MNKQALQAIVDNGFAVPDGRRAEDLLPALMEHLGSTDPILRERSMDVLDAWGGDGRLSDDTLIDLGTRMSADLSRGLGKEESDSVFRRSYAALILTIPLAADALFDAGTVAGRTGYLAPEIVRPWLDGALSSLRAERDLRGFVDHKGWAHAVAHMADALCQFARSPHVGLSQQQAILDAVADRLTTPVDSVFVQDEGGRLMRVVYHLLLRGELPLDAYVAWLDGLRTTPDGRTWGWGGLFDLESCDHRAVNARLNVCEALQVLHLFLMVGPRRWHHEDNGYYAFYDRPIAQREALRERVVETLRALYSGLVPPPGETVAPR